MSQTWRDRTIARVNESQEAVNKRKKRSRAGQVLFQVDLPFLSLLRQAAESRGMASSGYCRRAIAAFIARDLGIPFEEVCQHFSYPFKQGEAMTQGHVESRRAREGKTSDDGKGFGTWEAK